MLSITIPAQQGFNDETQEFYDIGIEQHLQLEHSLLSISKWESKWHIPFLNNKELTNEQLLDYVCCMSLNKISPDILKNLTKENLDEIMTYIQNPMTATKTYDLRPNSSTRGRSKNEEITSEVLYYDMFTYGIPKECEKWHLNRLMTLIKVFNVKNSDDKMSKRDAAAWQRAQNNIRRAKAHSKG